MDSSGSEQGTQSKEIKIIKYKTPVCDIAIQHLLTRQTRVNYFLISPLGRCQILFHNDE